MMNAGESIALPLSSENPVNNPADPAKPNEIQEREILRLILKHRKPGCGKSADAPLASKIIPGAN